MELANSFEVDAGAAPTWDLLMDIPRVVPCMPGATLLETVGDDRWRVCVKVRLGPMSMVFDADVARERADGDARSVTLAVRAREKRGRGQAKATIASSLEPLAAERTRVEVRTDLGLSGRIGQFGRGAVQEVASELTERFTNNLEQLVADAGATTDGRGATGPAQTADPTAAAPAPDGVRALPILLGSLRRLVARALGRVRGEARER